MTTRSRQPWTADDVPVCNCAGCWALLLGTVPPDRAKDFVGILKTCPKFVPRLTVAGRVKDRPYCRICLPSALVRVAPEGTRSEPVPAH